MESEEERSLSPASVGTHVSRAIRRPMLVCQDRAEATMNREWHAGERRLRA